MKVLNPHYQDLVREVFAKARFVNELGIQLKEVGPGWCETTLLIQPKHLQQNDFVHAGVQATMADHTSGAAGASLIKPGEVVLTSSFNVHFLRPGLGETLRCRADILKPGKSLLVVEAQVFAQAQGQEKLISKASVTLSVVPRA